jgi:hypothetical protein
MSKVDINRGIRAEIITYRSIPRPAVFVRLVSNLSIPKAGSNHESSQLRSHSPFPSGCQSGPCLLMAHFASLASLRESLRSSIYLKIMKIYSTNKANTKLECVSMIEHTSKGRSFCICRRFSQEIKRHQWSAALPRDKRPRINPYYHSRRVNG